MNIILTGANSKLGRRLLPSLLEEHSLSINYRGYNGSEKDNLLVSSFDLLKKDSYERLIRRSFSKFGKIDAVVNLAGYLSDKSLHDFNRKEFHLEMDTNIYSYFLMVKSLIKNESRLTKPAIIINFTISRPHKLYRKITMHAISKAGLEKLSNTFNEILGKEKIITKCIRMPDMQKKQGGYAMFHRTIMTLINNKGNGFPDIIELGSFSS